MNLRTELFLAWRYLQPKRNAVSVITCISIIGVTLGVGVLIVVLAVMTGFTDLMKEKLLETTSHIQIYDRYRPFIAKPKSVMAEVEKLGGTGLTVVNKPILIQRNDMFVAKMVFGVDPSKVEQRFNFSKDKNIREGRFSIEKNEVIVSEQIARELGLLIGDKIILHAPNKISKMIKVKEKGKVEFNDKAEVYLPGEFTVTAFYSFGKYDFDKNVIFMNIDDANELYGFPWGSASGVFVWTKDPFNIDPVKDSLGKVLTDKVVLSWKDINKGILGVLAVEKNMMFFLLVFIVLVAAFSIANTLITVVVQKTREIGLLKALGASSNGVMRIFIFQGFFVGFIGTCAGTFLGIMIIVFRNDIMSVMSKLTGREMFPREFYVFNELPAHIVAGDLVLIAVISVLLCTIGGVIPAWRAARLMPARALKYE